MAPQAPLPPAPMPPALLPQLSAQLDLLHLGTAAQDSTSSLGTTVLSPPCSPPGPLSPTQEPQAASPLLGLHAQPDPWGPSQDPEPMALASHSLQQAASPLASIGASPLASPSQEKEEAVEKADEEINQDDDEEEEEEEDERKVDLSEPAHLPFSGCFGEIGRAHV